MSVTKEMVAAMNAANEALIAARATNAGINAAKERMKNLLFNYYKDIVETANKSLTLEEEVAALENALDEMDEENTRLMKELDGLKKKTPKTKAQSSEG